MTGRSALRRAIQRLFATAGFDLRRRGPPWEQFPTLDFPPAWQDVIERITGHTWVSHERTGGLIQAVEHVVANEIPGAFVECGVFKGGSSMAAALTFLRLGDLRELYLFDTFEGMTEPREIDVDLRGVSAAEHYNAADPGAVASLDEVEAAMRSTGYPMDRVTLVQGRVEDTVPDRAPEHISVLRLDTDWYESTRHELVHLWPRVSRGGILIVDDYGHYVGARTAVDEYFANQGVFLHRLDYSGRLTIRN